MYNGIGLQTPRGTGTNGYVQRNIAFMRTRTERVPYKTEADIARHVHAPDRMPNQDILNHELKRKIEVKVMELADAMREQKFEEAEITERAKALRETLTAKENRATKSAAGHIDFPIHHPTAKLQYDEHGRLTGRNTHELSAATNERNRKLREAFKIGEYAPPPRKTKEQLDQERLYKYTKQYAIIPDAEEADADAKTHREKQEELLNMRQMEVLYKAHEKQVRADAKKAIQSGTGTDASVRRSNVGDSTRISMAEKTPVVQDPVNAKLSRALKRLVHAERAKASNKISQTPTLTGNSRRDPSLSAGSEASNESGSRLSKQRGSITLTERSQQQQSKRSSRMDTDRSRAHRSPLAESARTSVFKNPNDRRGRIQNDDNDRNNHSDADRRRIHQHIDTNNSRHQADDARNARRATDARHRNESDRPVQSGNRDDNRRRATSSPDSAAKSPSHHPALKRLPPKADNIRDNNNLSRQSRQQQQHQQQQPFRSLVAAAAPLSGDFPPPPAQLLQRQKAMASRKPVTVGRARRLSSSSSPAPPSSRQDSKRPPVAVAKRRRSSSSSSSRSRSRSKYSDRNAENNKNVQRKAPSERAKNTVTTNDNSRRRRRQSSSSSSSATSERGNIRRDRPRGGTDNKQVAARRKRSESSRSGSSRSRSSHSSSRDKAGTGRR